MAYKIKQKTANGLVELELSGASSNVSTMTQSEFDNATGGTTPDEPLDIFGVEKMSIDDNLIDGNKAKLLVDEYEKTLNLWNDLLSIATISSTGTIQKDTNNEYYIVIAPVESGKTYSSNSGDVYAFYSSYPTINSQSYNSTRYVASFTNITAPINGYVAIRVNKGTRNIVINEGSTALSFNQSYGAVIHKGDIEPTLLWENPSPTSSFPASSPITISTLSNYKYIVVEYKKFSGANDKVYAKFPTTLQDWSGFMTFWWTNNKMYIVGREIYTPNTNQIQFGIGYRIIDGVSDSDSTMCIPLRIYGTNIL